MKQLIKMSLLTLSMGLLGLKSQSQTNSENNEFPRVLSFETPQSPKWISDKGFWVVENNINQPRNRTIYFYNNKKQLVYKETITDAKFKLNKRKTLMRIKNTLETVLIAWEKGKPVAENEGFFVAAKENR